MDKPSKYESKFVIKRFEYNESLNFHEFFSPLIKWNTIMISLTNHYSWKMSQMDINTTFLTGDF